MKGLACGALVMLLWGGIALAGSLETYFGAGPEGASLRDINASILSINRVLADWNTTPTLTGGVPELHLLEPGITYVAGERFWISDLFALGGRISTFHAETSTTGSYTAAGSTSQVSVTLSSSAVSLVLGGEVQFLKSPVSLTLDAGVGYYYSGFSSDITFQVPSGVPAVAIHPHEGQDHFNASTLGVEGGLSLSYWLTEWLAVGARVGYRSTGSVALADGQGSPLDIDGNGTRETMDLTGLTVQFTLSLAISLPPLEGERRVP